MLLTDVFVCTGVEPPIFLLNQYACPISLFSPSLLRNAAYSWGHQKKKKKSEVSTIFSNLTLLTPWAIFSCFQRLLSLLPHHPQN